MASKDPHTYQLGCPPPVSHLCPHVSMERAHQMSLVGTPALGQRGKTHLLGQPIGCCKVGHAGLAPGKVNHGERGQQVLLCVLSCPDHCLHLAGDPIPQGFLPEWDPENSIAGCEVCHVPLAPRCYLLRQIKPCLPSVLALKTQMNLTGSLGSFFFALAMICESENSKACTEMLSYIFYFSPLLKAIAKHGNLLRSWLYTGSYQHQGPGLCRCVNKRRQSCDWCCSQSYSFWN